MSKGGWNMEAMNNKPMKIECNFDGKLKMIPVFNKDTPLNQETIEKSIVIAFNRIRDKEIKERMMNMSYIRLEDCEERDVYYIDIYEEDKRCCRLKAINTYFGNIVDHIIEG